MAGYWPISLLACLWTRNEQAWLIKDLLYMYEKRALFYFGTQWLMQSGQDTALFPLEQPITVHFTHLQR